MSLDAKLAALLRPELADLSPYAPHLPEGIEVRLDANEAPPNPSPHVREVIAEAIAKTQLERYPDARTTALRLAIAKRTGARPEELMIGTGSDEVISLVLTAMSRPRPPAPLPVVLTTTPTFVMYRITARGHGHTPVEVPLDAAWDLDVGAMKRAIEMLPPNVVFIASPNNPTGNKMSDARVLEVLEAAKGSLVIVDEAYIDYASASVRHWRADHPNLAILRTVSKVGLAALRVGWIEAHAELIAELDKVRQPFNVSATSQNAATAVLEHAWDDVCAHVAAVKRERDRVVHEIVKMGVTVTPSDANFVWIKTPQPAAEVFGKLVQKGVLVRSFHHIGGRMTHQLRVTIGSPKDNDRLLEALAACAV